jgi:hypothetical protein
LYAKYEDHEFDDSNFFIALTNDNLFMSWFSYLNGSADVVYFSFPFVDWKYLLYQSHLDVATNLQHVTKDVFN